MTIELINLGRIARNPLELILSKFNEGYSHIGLGETHDDNRLHRFAGEILAILKKQVGLRFLCLELESEIQPSLDMFLKTGEEKYLEVVIGNERDMVQRGYPMGVRLNGAYFDIIRQAYAINLPVIAIDNHGNDSDEDMELRDEFMASIIPTEGPTLIYVGLYHLLPFMLPNSLKRRQPTSRIYTIGQFSKSQATGTVGKIVIPHLVNKISEPVAFDLTDANTNVYFERQMGLPKFWKSLHLAYDGVAIHL